MGSVEPSDAPKEVGAAGLSGAGRPGRSSWQRTHTCGELRVEHVGQQVTLNGWVDARRDLGGIYFLELRDRYGKTQLVVQGELGETLKVGPEFVLSVRGEVREREERNKNLDRPTGAIEVWVETAEVLSVSATPPIEVADELDASVENRLRYRYLDLRRGPMQSAVSHRARFISAMRRAFDSEGFLDIETPILTKATPEGARDYLVPSRVHPGEFYALPQSPQIFKQILMVSGFDRYYQVARCFRDEDLRADRQPEFTQLDMEMSFVEEDDVFATWERVLVATFRDALGVELNPPFPRMRWIEAMERFGLDKPDTRFGMELINVADWAQACDFGVFKGALEKGGRVMAIVVPSEHAFSRKQVGELESYAKEYGAKGLAWWKAGAEGGAGPLARFVGDEASTGRLMELLGASEGDLCLFCADSRAVTWRVLGELRNHLAKRLGLLPEGQWNFLWVTHFPMFELDPDSERWVALHHPFTAPQDWDMGGADASSEQVADLDSRAYDLVLNGWELGSGSIRIHRQDVQERVFELLGISADEQQRKFGFLLEALAYGAPPHGGFALGLDRLAALTAGRDNIRDLIAFPKTTSAADLMCQAPSTIDPKQLAEVHVQTTVSPDAKTEA